METRPTERSGVIISSISFRRLFTFRYLPFNVSLPVSPFRHLPYGCVTDRKAWRIVSSIDFTVLRWYIWWWSSRRTWSDFRSARSHSSVWITYRYIGSRDPVGLWILTHAVVWVHSLSACFSCDSRRFLQKPQTSSWMLDFFTLPSHRVTVLGEIKNR